MEPLWEVEKQKVLRLVEEDWNIVCCCFGTVVACDGFEDIVLKAQ